MTASVRACGVLACVALAGAAASGEAFAARITAEKNCNVRVDSGEFSPGQRIVVVQDVGGRKKKVAIVQITRKSGKNALGKVVKGPKDCSGLRGLAVEEGRGSGGSSDKTASKLPKLDTAFNFGTIMFTGAGIHQKTSQADVKLMLFGYELAGDVYPMMFAGKNPIFSMIGLGARFVSARAVPDIEVTSPDGDASKTGKQQTTPTDFAVDLIGRYGYLNDTMISELRIGYLSHSLTHTLSSGASLERSPLRDLEVSGFAVGVKQRYKPMEFLRFNLGFGYPILSGTADATTEQGEDKTSKAQADLEGASGLLVDLSGDFLYKMFKISGGMAYSSYGGNVKLESGASHAIAESNIFLFLGIGVTL